MLGLGPLDKANPAGCVLRFILSVQCQLVHTTLRSMFHLNVSLCSTRLPGHILGWISFASFEPITCCISMLTNSVLTCMKFVLIRELV